MHPPGRSTWWLAFTPMITKQQSESDLPVLRDAAVLPEMCS